MHTIKDIFIHSCNNPHSTFCNCQTIISVTRTKYLGIIMDWNLSWAIHIGYLLGKSPEINYIQIV